MTAWCGFAVVQEWADERHSELAPYREGYVRKKLVLFSL